ncbi:MAG: hypothetical protein WD426_14800 [Anditalea sp.]
MAISDEVQDPIVLQIEPLPFTPTEFYISGLVDERKDPSAVAWLIPSRTGSAKPVAVDLQGGGKTAIETFVLQSLPRNKKLFPVIIRLQEFHIKEKTGQKGVVEGELALHMSFDLQRESGPVHLMDYQGGLRYLRSANQYGVVEPSLRRSLGNALEYLHDWMEREALTNVKLTRGVKVILSDYVQDADGDTVFYTPERPLRWEDFKAKPQPGNYVASVFPSFAWEGGSEVVDGYIHLHLQTKVYMLKSSSWVRHGARNAYGLNHEQRHFDIVKLVVERFKKKILTMELSPDDYEGIIGYQYLESFREMNHLQDEYDKETSHGINKAVQEKWNKRIDEELRDFGVIE